MLTEYREHATQDRDNCPKGRQEIFFSRQRRVLTAEVPVTISHPDRPIGRRTSPVRLSY